MQAPLPVILADNCTPLLRSFLCPSADSLAGMPPHSPRRPQVQRVGQDGPPLQTHRLVWTSWWTGGAAGRTRESEKNRNNWGWPTWGP